MAKSYAHMLGEFLGVFFEDLMKVPIRDFAEKNHLYFDCYGSRGSRSGKKVTWVDVHGSKHDLDFVLESGGDDCSIGVPVAFIELAWRRYTKHSKNKAQEISGAINPICEKYRLSAPFKGVILGGEFTGSSIRQLQEEGFCVLYISFQMFIDAFQVYGFDVGFDESTKESEFKKKFREVSKKENRMKLDLVRQEILKVSKPQIDPFMDALARSYNRKISHITVLPLHGTRVELMNVDQAIQFVDGYLDLPNNAKLEYIEITVTYNNGSVIQCRFKEKEEAVGFLQQIQGK